MELGIKVGLATGEYAASLSCVHVYIGTSQAAQYNCSNFPYNNICHMSRGLCYMMISCKYISVLATHLSVVDISGGYSPSILDAMRLALHTSKAVWFKKGGDNEYVPLNHHEALYLATVGGAQGH